MTAGRRFEVRVLWNGAENQDLLLKSFEIDSNRYEACDTAVLTFAVRAGVAVKEVVSARCWVSVEMRDLNEAYVEWVPLFQGYGDHARLSGEQSLLEMECRDALASLLDLRVRDAWLNHTRSDLLHAVAQAAGLGARVTLPDDGMVGQFWQVEHKRGALLAQHRFQTAADMAFAVARESFCDLYADGKTLVCEPPVSGGDIVDGCRDVFRVDVSRDLQMQAGVCVHVASWDSRQRSSTHVYYDGETYSVDAPANGGVLHSFRTPGRRLEDLKRMARGKHERIAAHAVSARVFLPGRIGLRPRQVMRVSSGGMEDVLGVDQVVSRFSLEDGFVQHAVLRKRSHGHV